jgi:4-hydroxy-4-methyl-2-oxoglutarate aldolase
VSVGELPVNPGDFVLGDSDGVVVVPAGRLEEVATLAVKQHEHENAREDRLRSGEPITEVLRSGSRDLA